MSILSTHATLDLLASKILHTLRDNKYPINDLYGEPAIMEAKRRRFKYVWNSKEKKPIAVEDARSYPPAHVQLYNLSDDLFRD